MPTLKDELKAKAKELNIEVKDDMTDETLQTAISEKEKQSTKSDISKEELLEKIKYFEEEQKKIIETRDRVKQEKRDIAKELKDLQSKLETAPKNEEFEELKAKMSEYEKEKAEREAKEEEEKLKKLDEASRIKIEFEKKFSSLSKEMEEKLQQTYGIVEEKQKALDEKDSKISSLSKRALMNEIKSEAAANGAISPSQIVKMTIGDFDWDDANGEFINIERDAKGKEINFNTVSEYIKRFLEDEVNANLVKATSDGSGLETKSTTTSKKSTDSSTSNKLYGKYDPKNPIIIREAEVRGLTPERWAGIRLKEDQAMGRVPKEDK